MVAPRLRDSIPISTDSALIKPLRVPCRTDAATGYRGVYPHKNGYRGVVKFGGQLVRVCPVLYLPSQAAERVARWFAERLGLHWAKLIEQHRRHIWRYAPWKVTRERTPDGRFAGYGLTVWEWGMEVEVTHLGRRGKRLKSRPKLFASWREAADHVPVWMRMRWGLLATLALYREDRQAGSPHAWESKATRAR